MSRLESIEDFLAHKRVAIVGVSREPNDFSRALFREFRQRGYDAVPVNPEAADIDGQPCFARLQDIHPPVDGALFMTPPSLTEKLVRDCAEAGIRRVWMFRGAGRGAVSPEAVEFCESQGIAVIAGECPYMFFPGGPWFHHFHGFLRRVAGSYPH